MTLLSDVVPGGEKLLTQRMLAADEDMNYLKTTGDVGQLLLSSFPFLTGNVFPSKLFQTTLFFRGNNSCLEKNNEKLSIVTIGSTRSTVL